MWNPHFKIFGSIGIEGKKHCADKTTSARQMSRSEPQTTSVWPLPCSVWLCLLCNHSSCYFSLAHHTLTTLASFQVLKFFSSSILRVLCASYFPCLQLFGVVLQTSAQLSLPSSGISWPLPKITIPVLCPLLSSLIPVVLKVCVEITGVPSVLARSSMRSRLVSI